MLNPKDLLPPPPWEGPPFPRTFIKREDSLPLKSEMDELDKLLDKASGILMRWRFKMSPDERAEFPKTFKEIDRAEKAMSDIADALVGISTQLGFSPFRESEGK